MGYQHGRIPMLERDQVAPEVAALYDALEQQRGVVPYMFKTLAHTPALHPEQQWRLPGQTAFVLVTEE